MLGLLTYYNFFQYVTNASAERVFRNYTYLRGNTQKHDRQIILQPNRIIF
jgi:hypothetical protein